MSSLLLTGYLALCNGRRLTSENPSTKKTTQHLYYDTVIQTMGVDIPAEIRWWAPATEPIMPDGTIVDALVKVYAPSNGKAQLDAVEFHAFPGDCQSSKYEESIPDRPFPTLIVLGTTSGAAETMDDGISVGYTVATSEYVRDQARVSRVYCRFDGTKPRWKKTPRPSAGSAVFVVGAAYGLHLAGGNLIVDVDQLVLNVGMAAASSTAARVEAPPVANGDGSVPAKRRRFPTTVASAPKQPTEYTQQGTTPATNGVVLDANAPGADVVDENAVGEVDEHAPSPTKVRRIGRRTKQAEE